MPRIKLFSEEIILNRAMELFWKKGYHNTSVQDLVDHLGINRASIYDTFGGKQALFNKTLKLYSVNNYDELKNFLNYSNNIKETLRLLFQSVVESDCSDTENKGCFIANTTTELLPGDNKLQIVLNEHKKKIEELFYNALNRAVKTGEISNTIDLKTFSRLLSILMVGIRVVGKVSSDEEELLASVNAVLSLLD